MAYSMTPWGYEVDGDVAPIITPSQFNDMTGNRWANDERADAAIAAASAAVRNSCGWHVSPAMSCRATLDTDGGASLWLPTSCLNSVTSLTVGGAEVEGYQWSRIGQILPDERIPAGLQAATVEYVAGMDAPGDIAAMVAGIASRALAISPGVTSETAGGVSVSFASSLSMVAYASLTDTDRDALAAYRVVRSHAA